MLASEWPTEGSGGHHCAPFPTHLAPSSLTALLQTEHSPPAVERGAGGGASAWHRILVTAAAPATLMAGGHYERPYLGAAALIPNNNAIFI